MYHHKRYYLRKERYSLIQHARASLTSGTKITAAHWPSVWWIRLLKLSAAPFCETCKWKVRVRRHVADRDGNERAGQSRLIQIAPCFQWQSRTKGELGEGGSARKGMPPPTTPPNFLLMNLQKIQNNVARMVFQTIPAFLGTSVCTSLASAPTVNLLLF